MLLAPRSSRDGFRKLSISLSPHLKLHAAFCNTDLLASGEKTGLAMSIYESLSSLGSVANSGLTPRLIVTYTIVTAAWFSSILALGLAVLSTIYVMMVDIADEPEEKEEKKESFIASLRHLPRTFWYISCICLTGYGCLLPFFNSAQRFIASRYYSDDQTKAGLAVRYSHLFHLKE